MKKLKRHSVVAVLILTLSFCLVQLAALYLDFYEQFGLALFLVTMIGWHVYRSFYYSKEISMQQQFKSIIKKISTPVFIADAQQHIIYTSEHFDSSSLATLFLQINSLSEFISYEENGSPSSHVMYSKEMIDMLGGKVKGKIIWREMSYGWTMIPLFSPQGTRLGTLVECVPHSEPQSKEAFDLDNKNTEIEHELTKLIRDLTNLTLYQKDKMYLDTYAYHHPLIKNALKMIQKLYDEAKRSKEKIEIEYSSQPLSQAIQEIQSDVGLLLQEIVNIKHLAITQTDVCQAYDHRLEKIFRSSELSFFKTIRYFEIITAVLEQLHKNQAHIVQLRNLMEKVNILPDNIVIAESGTLVQEVVTLLDSVRQALAASKEQLHKLLMELEALKAKWGDSLNDIKLCVTFNQKAQELLPKLNDSSLAAEKYTESVKQKFDQFEKLTHQCTVLKANEIQVQNKTDQFELVALEIDPMKKEAEDVLLEGIMK